MTRYVRECETIPRWYGVAWFEASLMRWACLPIPINVIARGFRNWWVAARKPHGEDIEQEAYLRGYNDAYSSAYTQGSESVWRKLEILKEAGALTIDL